MRRSGERENHLGWIELQLRVDHPEFPQRQIIADSHYGSFDHVACVNIWGVEGRCRRVEIRQLAEEFLRALGYEVGFQPGRDTYELHVDPPTSAHEEIDFLRSLHRALAKSVKPGGRGDSS